MPDIEGQEPTSPQGQEPTPAPMNAQDVSSLPEWAQKLLIDTRKEAASYRTANKELSAYRDQAEAAKLSASERLEADMKAAEQRASAAQERVLRSEIKLAAQAADVVDPDAAYALLDKSKIEIDESGEPTNVAKLMSDLVAAKPYLVKAPAKPEPPVSNASAANPIRPRADGYSVDAMVDAAWRKSGRGSNPFKI